MFLSASRPAPLSPLQLPWCAAFFALVALSVQPASAQLVPPVAPAVSPLGGSYSQAQTVTLSDSTPGAIIYYLVNGGTPIKYVAPFTVAASETIQAVAVTVGGGTYAAGPVNAQTYTIAAPTTPQWTRLTNLPALFATQGSKMMNVGDTNLYAISNSSAASPNTISIFVASQSNINNWVNITTPSLSQNSTEFARYMGMMPNGTVLLSESNNYNTSDVFYWNGSTTNPAWTKITGWNASSSSNIYNFTNDSAGYTYFSPAWSGDIWRNDAPNSTNFTRIFTNLYSLIGNGATGGLYQTRIWNLNDGNGDMLWACGEGSLLNVNLAFTKVTQYLNASGYRGNCFGLGKSANNILALREADPGGDELNRISIATRATAVLPSSDPVTAPYYPAYMNSNSVNSVQWIYGTKWVLNNGGHSLFNLLLSQDDGSTWTDITATGAIDASCKGANMDDQAVVVGHYVIARCQVGELYWMYGPV